MLKTKTNLSQPFTLLRVLSLLTLALLVSSVAALAQGGGSSPKPARIPATQRFSDHGLHPATGRSGSASLSVRALLNKDGKTDVEMTTGVMDQQDPPPPGHIRKAQLKPLNQDGDPIYTRNYNGLTGGGYFATQVDGLSHLQQVQVQTNIDGIDGRRTNVVTVVETVKKRPDLAVSNLAPGSGRVGVPLNITVLVSELNGDVGATANCVLYEGETEIDRAQGIYLDAGTVVTVAFTHTFTTAGTKQLEVRLEQINPGDWDGANNSVAGNIVITQPNDNLSYNASISDQQGSFLHSETHKQGDHDPLYGFLAEYGNTNDVQNASQSVHLDGIALKNSAFPYSFAVNETGDGGTTNLNTALTVPNNGGTVMFDIFGFHLEQNNGFAANPDQNVSVFVSNLIFTFSGNTVQQYTSVQYDRFAGAVTYLSTSFDRYWYLDNGVRVDVSDYVTNNTGGSTNGTRLPVGAQYAISLSLNSADAQVFTATPVMDVQTDSGSFTSLNVCNGSTFGTFFNEDCEQTTFSFTLKQGSASFTAPPVE
jgi:hypothetical protein